MKDQKAIRERVGQAPSEIPPEAGEMETGKIGYEMRDGILRDTSLLRLARCEECGSDSLYVHWPADWVQTGGSRWGTTYSADGIAWRCPQHRSR